MTAHVCRKPSNYGAVNRTEANPDGRTWTCPDKHCKKTYRATLTGWVRWDLRKHRQI